MKIHEYQAKELLKARGIAIPPGLVMENAAMGQSVAARLGFPLVVKAQVHVGGRGKAGAIRVVSNEEDFQKALTDILSMSVKGLKVKKVLVEKALDIKRQLYLGITVDRSRQGNVIMVSTQGGIDIEEVARQSPEKIVKLFLKGGIKPGKKEIEELVCALELQARVHRSCVNMLEDLFQTYLGIDAELLEINPLVLTQEDQLVACDAKIVLDDNALFRQPNLKTMKEESEDNELEAQAHARGLAYVKLPGDIGIIGNGAGLVMATMDEVKRAGGRPANFLDIGGGAKAELMKNAVELILKDPEVRGVFINIFGGITRCDEVAKGIILAFAQKSENLPVVIRLDGTRSEEARDLLAASQFLYAPSMEEGARRIVALTASPTRVAKGE